MCHNRTFWRFSKARLIQYTINEEGALCSCCGSCLSDGLIRRVGNGLQKFGRLTHILLLYRVTKICKFPFFEGMLIPWKQDVLGFTEIVKFVLSKVKE
jgi:hypothetical protein